MDQNDNKQQNTLLPEPMSTIQTPNVEKGITPGLTKKKRSTAAVSIAFLLGALCYALLGMGYNLYTQQAQAHRLADAIVESIKTTDGIDLQVQGSKNAAAVDESQAPSSISKDDLSNYVEPVDCTTKTEYSDLKVSQSLTKILSIDLYDGILVRNSSVGTTIKWDTLPKVVDYKCNTIKITDLSVGDRINVFVSANSTTPKDALLARMIQKANK